MKKISVIFVMVAGFAYLASAQVGLPSAGGQAPIKPSQAQSSGMKLTAGNASSSATMSANIVEQNPEGNPIAQASSPLSFLAQELSDKQKEKIKEIEKTSHLAVQGDPVAQNKMGDFYADGDILQRDMRMATYWWYEAAQRREPNALCRMGEIYFSGTIAKRNMHRAVEYWKLSAVAGNPQAQYFLGSCYANGGQGVYRDYEQAAFWWRKSAAQGNIRAIHNLAYCYARGQGIEKKDPRMAYELWRRAAESGFVAAQTQLALCYFSGEGVDKDPKLAANIWTAAAEKGDAEAQRYLGFSYYFGLGVPNDKNTARSLFEASALQGDEQAKKAYEEIVLEVGLRTATSPEPLVKPLIPNKPVDNSPHIFRTQKIELMPEESPRAVSNPAPVKKGNK